MSVVFLSNAPATVDIERLRAVAAKHNVKIPDDEEDYYRHLLNGLDATAQQVADLPEYEDPRLQIEPETLPRQWFKQKPNPLNGWSHRAEIKSPSPKDKRLDNRTVAFKDNVSIGGVPLTGGTTPEILTGKSEYPVPKIDAVVVKRVLEAAGTVSGSANCEHLSMSPLSFTSFTGPIRNPWARGYTTGGSSSGCAALVGINQVKEWRKRHGLPSIDEELGEGVDMAIGGDQGGSIRLPSAYAGIYGMKPTHGLVPYSGILSLFPMIDHTGPMTTNLGDLATLLGVVAGYDGIDPRCTPETPLREKVPDYSAQLASFIQTKQAAGEWTTTAAGKGLRIGVITESLAVPNLSPGIFKVIQEAISQFESIGASVSHISIPEHLLGPSIWTIATRAGIASLGMRNMPPPLLCYPCPDITPPALSQSSFDILDRHNPASANMVFNATLLQERPDGASLAAKAMMHVHELRAAYDRALAEVDVLITPVITRMHSQHPSLDAKVEDKMKPAIGSTLNTCQFNVTGHPALSMPAGWGKAEDGDAKMPVAMQIIGKRFDEESVIKAAAAWEVGGLGLDKWDGR
ncbi:amidase signature domain-containing protein [Phyllosticta capitalensis]